MTEAGSYSMSLSKEDIKWLENWKNPYVRLIAVCRICAKEQKSTKLLVWKAHFLTHSAVKPFNCEICQKGFVQQTAFKTHMKNNHPTAVSMAL